MIEDLALDGLVLQIHELVVDDQVIRPGGGLDPGDHPDLRSEERRLFDVPLDDNLMRRLITHVHRDVRRRSVGDLAVEAEGGVAFRAVVLPGLDLERSTVVGQTAPGKQFVEPGEPAQAAVCGKVDECRVHRPIGDRRGPAQPLALVGSVPDVHAPSGHDRECESAVVDLDQVDAVAPAPSEPAFPDRALCGRGQKQGIIVEGEALDPDVVGQVGQDERCHGDSLLRDSEIVVEPVPLVLKNAVLAPARQCPAHFDLLGRLTPGLPGD